MFSFLKWRIKKKGVKALYFNKVIIRLYKTLWLFMQPYLWKVCYIYWVSKWKINPILFIEFYRNRNKRKTWRTKVWLIWHCHDGTQRLSCWSFSIVLIKLLALISLTYESFDHHQEFFPIIFQSFSNPRSWSQFWLCNWLWSFTSIRLRKFFT